MMLKLKTMLIKKYIQLVYIYIHTHTHTHSWDIPGGSVVKKPPANAGDTGSIPDPGESHLLQSS